jgi:GR25 family glycosyltransferase involved in LPS biosynthesis
MISMSDNPISQYYANTCKKTWESFGYHVNHFEAVTPKTLDDCSELHFGLKRNVKDFTLTEKSIWYSHFYLWEKCLDLDEAIVIIEHDCYLFDHLPDEFDEVHFFTKSVSKKIVRKGSFGRVSPAAGYILTPKFAKKLIDCSKSKTIQYNVDGEIMDLSNKRDYCDSEMIAMQLVEDEVGTTISH